MAFYAGGAPLEEVRVTHPLAVVEAVEDTSKRLNQRGIQLMNGVHAAFTGRIGKDAEVRTTRDGKPWASLPRVGAGGPVRRCRGRPGPEAHQGRRGLLRGA